MMILWSAKLPAMMPQSKNMITMIPQVAKTLVTIPWAAKVFAMILLTVNAIVMIPQNSKAFVMILWSCESDHNASANFKSNKNDPAIQEDNFKDSASCESNCTCTTSHESVHDDTAILKFDRNHSSSHESICNDPVNCEGNHNDNMVSKCKYNDTTFFGKQLQCFLQAANSDCNYSVNWETLGQCCDSWMQLWWFCDPQKSDCNGFTSHEMRLLWYHNTTRWL